MAYSELEEVLIENDCQAVIDELAHWREEERATAWQQVCLLRSIRSYRNDADSLSATASMKMEALRLEYGEEVLEKIRYGISEALELVQVGLSPTPYIPIDMYGNKKLQVRVARLLVDRRPPWLDDWYRSMTQDLAWNMDYVLWVCFFHAGLIPKPEDDSPVLQRLIERFPDSFDACPEEAKWTLRELPSLRLSVLDVCNIGPYLAGAWAPAAKWLAQNDLVDRPQAVRNALAILKKTKKQADRRPLMRFVRAIDATGLELLPLQSDLAELLADKLLDIAGNAILELNKIAGCGRLEPIVLKDLPRVFLDKTKLYALNALELAGVFSTDVNESGRAMCVAVAALDHIDSVVQQTALKMLKNHLRNEHHEARQTLERARDRLSRQLGSAVDDLLSINTPRTNSDFASLLTTSTKPAPSPKELQRILKDLTSASTGRLERIKTAFEQEILKDDRFREALINSIEDRNIELANFIAEHVLPTLEPSVLPDLKSKLNLKGKLSHGRRLRLIYKLDSTVGKPLVRQAIENGSVEVKSAAITCLEDNDEDWPLLLKAFQSDTETFRVAASRTLCGMHGPRAIELQLGILDSQDALLVLDSFLQHPVPAVVFRARQIVREKISELLDATNGEYKNQPNPQLVAQLRIAASIKDDDAAELLIECLRAANIMSDQRNYIYDLESVAFSCLLREFEQGLRILIQNRDEISVSFLGELLSLARDQFEPRAVFDAFSGYLRESDASGDSREYKSFRSIMGEICKRNGTAIGDYLECLDRNRDLDPRWLDVALERSLHDAILSLLVPGHLDTWNYLLERSESEQIRDVESRSPETVLGLLLSGYSGAGEICMCALREAYVKDSYSAQCWLHLASLLSTNECEELEAMRQDSLCPKVNQEIIALAIQEIGKRVTNDVNH